MKSGIKDRKKYLPLFVVAIISIYALYLRLQRLAGHTFTPDEWAQIYFINRPFLDLLKNIPNFEFCSYTTFGDYFLTWPFFKIFGDNKWGLAIPHIIATVLGFYLLYLICKLYFKTIWGYIITFVIVCFNATLIIHATELRPYAILPTLALATFFFSRLLVEQPDISIKKKWLLGAFFVLAIWTHVYGIAMFFLAVTFNLLSKLYDKSFKAILKTNMRLFFIVLCIAMPLWFYSVFGPHKPIPAFYGPVMFAHIPNPVIDIIGFLKAIFGNLMGYKKLYLLLVSIIFPFIIPCKDRFKQVAFLFIMVFLPILLILLADLKSKYYFVQRQFIWVMPFFAFFMGWTWESLIVYIYEKFHFSKNRLVR